MTLYCFEIVLLGWKFGSLIIHFTGHHFRHTTKKSISLIKFETCLFSSYQDWTLLWYLKSFHYFYTLQCFVCWYKISKLNKCTTTKKKKMTEYLTHCSVFSPIASLSAQEKAPRCSQQYASIATVHPEYWETFTGEWIFLRKGSNPCIPMAKKTFYPDVSALLLSQLCHVLKKM